MDDQQEIEKLKAQIAALEKRISILEKRLHEIDTAIEYHAVRSG